VSDTRSVQLTWTGEGQVFDVGLAHGVQLPIDGDRHQGASPMDQLLASVGACMAIDVLVILEKSRVPLTALRLVAEGERRDDEPRHFVSLALRYEVSGPAPEHQAKLERAVELSRDKYCSVLHTLRPDLDVTIDIVST